MYETFWHSFTLEQRLAKFLCARMMACGQRGVQWAPILLTSLSVALGFFCSRAFGTPGRPSLDILMRNSCESVDKHAVQGGAGPTCNKFILLTTQRSGSTWFCEAIGHQPEVFCPFHGEMLIQYSRYTEHVSAENWTKAADQAFDAACKQARKEGKMIAGFKLMYNQVKGPSKTVNGTNLPDEWFQDYLKARRVRIVHLVREAVILHMASDYQTAVDVKRLKLTGRNSHHTTDANIAAARRNATMFRFTAGHLPLLQSREKEHKHWLDFLQKTGLPYQYLSYEDLMSSRRDIFVHMVLQFLGVKDMVSYPQLQGLLLRIHRVTCENRIADFNAVRKLIRGTMSERACKILEHSSFQ